MNVDLGWNRNNGINDMDKFEEAIGRKKLAIDILKEYKTTIAIEWLSDKGVNDFISLDPHEDYGELCFKFHDNEYRVINYKEDKLTIYFNDCTVLRVLYVEKDRDGIKSYEFDWDDDNTVQELRLYDWVEDLPIIMNKEIEKSKTKKTRSEIKFEKEQELVKSQIVNWIDRTISLGKFSEPGSSDHKDYISFK
jgi:hypothetical protein